MTDWDSIKDFYKTYFGIEDWIVELYANLDILQLCASGASNKTISEFLEIDLDDIAEVLLNTFKFSGWKEDLPVNPYKLYLSCEDLGHLAEARFISEMTCCLGAWTEKDRTTAIYTSYWICRTFQEIEERIQDEWI